MPFSTPYEPPWTRADGLPDKKVHAVRAAARPHGLVLVAIDY